MRIFGPMVFGLWCVTTACDLGAQDYSRVTISRLAADQQPADPANGIAVEIAGLCENKTHVCLLDATISRGSITRAGETSARASSCEPLFTAQPLALLIRLDDGSSEAVVQARLLDGGDQSKCMGAILAETESVIAARVISSPDAGGSDGSSGSGSAGGSDAH